MELNVSQLVVISSEHDSGVGTIKARVTVAVAPLLKTLQDNKGQCCRPIQRARSVLSKQNEKIAIIGDNVGDK